MINERLDLRYPLPVELQAAEGSVDVLWRTAPEVRAPAVELLETLWPEGARLMGERRPPWGRRRRK